MDKDRRYRLGSAIRTMREQQNLSQRKLALMAGTNQSYLWEIETGQTSVGLDLLCQIADALGVPVQELIDF